MISIQLIDDFLNILPAALYQYVLYPDGSNELLYISPATNDILGHTPEYFMQDLNRFWNMVHPDDLERLLKEDFEANRKKTLFVSEVRVRMPDGQQRWVQLSSRPTSEMKNDSVVWIGYIIDITRVKQIEMELVEANRQLKALSLTDGLTGLANRRHFDEMLNNEWARFKRTQHPFSLILLDIDFFKNYNDHYGHQMGDDCLKRIASILQKHTRRAGDLAARYGGDELIIIAFNTNAAAALEMAENIHQSVESLRIKNENTSLGMVTISIGVATIMGEEYQSEQHLLKAADIALYQAKKDGRNCVRVAGTDAHQ